MQETGTQTQLSQQASTQSFLPRPLSNVHTQSLGTLNMAPPTMGFQQMSPMSSDNVDFIMNVIKNATSAQLIRFGNEAFTTLHMENVALKAQVESLR